MSDGLVLPDFLFIGPDKSGSTWMYRVLRRHPHAFVPHVKDIYFFDRYYDRGIGWYASFFRDAPIDAKAVGELSHDYLFSELAAKRIRRDLPGVRLFCSLRDPADRSFSQYLYMKRSGLTRKTFEEALKEFPEIVDNSMYYAHLRRYLRLFEPSRLKVLFFDDLAADPQAFAGQMFDFLDLEAQIDLDYGTTVLPASRPRSGAAARLAKEGANWARRLGFPGLVGAVKGSAVTRWLYAPYRAGEKPSLSPVTRRRLVEGFRDDVEHLQDIVERDLGHWLRTEYE